MDERRQFSRILFDANATLTQQGNVWPTIIHDLSLNGVLLEQPQGFSVTDDPIALSFTLGDSEIVVSMETKLVYQKEGQLGLECLHIDVDSISHLRRMLELNLGDASLLDRELRLFVEVHEQS
ncbi:PilZ domain-containing protein [Shewanella colwelliana]|uniref:Cyclic diguanosine monophosphate-binding protein n=1 Tax=Shewanella colwelliana TaxID=23 RepID=A0A1E5ISL1_SHECO|nr:PilZ domain-containing protein [Shewanella colwelliana]MDX1281939.1 PilZ domain-containing protein [Shewanella colwelliana]OEG73516.1 pilus assembly protein [Shewanella colwelliana]